MAGLALRRYPESWLIQGSVLLRPIPRPLTQAMPREGRAELEQYAAALSEFSSAPCQEKDVALRWASYWSSWWEEALLETLGAAHEV